MTTDKITQREIFLYASNRVEEQLAKDIRRACVQSKEIRNWLFAICDDAPAIYATAVQEFMSGITPQMLAESDESITEAYRQNTILKGDDFLINSNDPPNDEQGQATPEDPQGLESLNETQPLDKQHAR